MSIALQWVFILRIWLLQAIAPELLLLMKARLLWILLQTHLVTLKAQWQSLWEMTRVSQWKSIWVLPSLTTGLSIGAVPWKHAYRTHEHYDRFYWNQLDTFCSLNRVVDYITNGVRYVFRGDHGAGIINTFSQDLEPESVAISNDDRFAFISCQVIHSSL